MNSTQENSLHDEVVIYTDEALDFGEKIEDFLPSPEELAKAPRKVNMTISLDVETLALLKQMAKKRNLSYRKLIEKLLETYTQPRENQHNSLPRAIVG